MECPRVGLDRFQRARRVGDDMGTAPAKAIGANSTLLHGSLPLLAPPELFCAKLPRMRVLCSGTRPAPATAVVSSSSAHLVRQSQLRCTYLVTVVGNGGQPGSIDSGGKKLPNAQRQLGRKGNQFQVAWTSSLLPALAIVARALRHDRPYRKQLCERTSAIDRSR